MRVLFAGSPGIAVPALEAVFCLAEGGGLELAGLLTNADSPKGRRGTPEPTELALAAERFSARRGAAIPVLKSEQLDAAARERIAALKPDLLVSFAYGRIFGPKFLALFPRGGINIHPSLLPKYRGPAPIPAAILAGDRETGISVQKLALEMDSGDILAQERFALSGRETTAELSALAARKAAEMLPPVLEAIAAGKARGRPQNHLEASYCSLIGREAGRVDWTQSAVKIDAQIRAFDPWPLCWTTHREQRLLILKACPADLPEETAFDPKEAGTVLGVDKERGILVQTGAGLLAVTELQYHGKKPLKWRDFLNGARNFQGSRLGQR